LLGCISSDEVRDNKDKNDGWCERDYIIIAKSSDVSPYSGNQKWWTPNNNSTCICIPNTELSLFEAYILKPYFNITLNNLLQNVESNKKYTKEDFLNDKVFRNLQNKSVKIERKSQLERDKTKAEFLPDMPLTLDELFQFMPDSPFNIDLPDVANAHKRRH